MTAKRLTAVAAVVFIASLLLLGTAIADNPPLSCWQEGWYSGKGTCHCEKENGQLVLKHTQGGGNCSAAESGEHADPTPTEQLMSNSEQPTSHDQADLGLTLIVGACLVGLILLVLGAIVRDMKKRQ